MAKYSPASQEVEDLVNDIANELNLVNYGVDVQPLYVSKAKVPCSIIRANELVEYASDRKDLVWVLCYLDAFEGADKQGHPLVDEKTKYMWIRNELEKIKYDTEKDKFSTNGPCITVPLSFLESVDKTLVVNQAILGLHVMAQIEEMKKEKAAEEKAKKKGKKGKKNEDE